MYLLFKFALTALVVVAVSEMARRNAAAGALIKSLPLVSLLAMFWIYAETRDTRTIADLSQSTFWLVLPTLPFFLVLPWLLRLGWGFWPALVAALLVMGAGYGLFVRFFGYLLP